MHKCKEKDCNRQIDDDLIYCSFECACYDGTFSVTKGWLVDPKSLKEKE